MRQRDTQREELHVSSEGGAGASSDESWHKLGVIEVNMVNEMEMWDPGG